MPLEKSEARILPTEKEFEPVPLEEILTLAPLEDGRGGGCDADVTVEASTALPEEVVVWCRLHR